MARKSVHVVKHDGGWAVMKEGGRRASVVAPTQGEAIDAGRRIARRDRTELVIHGRDGRIREKDSHGHDPHPPQG
ncbi:MAG TPA: DUF2188 domain-containing protein [Myxococcales bacterium]|nr:DUF2188 domain-containing protein [Myxococcales bacterium]